MPYILQERRTQIVEENPAAEERIALDEIRNAGELNFAITKLVTAYFFNSPGNYQAINDVVGALESAKLEFYRRIAAPYEEKKSIQNGDVYFSEGTPEERFF